MLRALNSSSSLRMMSLATQLQGGFSSASEAPVLFNRVTPSLLKVTLNKPKALNSLDMEMIGLIQGQLTSWEKDA